MSVTIPSTLDNKIDTNNFDEFFNLIRQDLDNDEDYSNDFLSNLYSNSNGYYYYNTNPIIYKKLTSKLTHEIPSMIKSYVRKSLEWKSFAGIFHNLSNYVYITVDSTLFLWNYHNGKCKEYTIQNNQIITSVSLVKPAKGIFHEKISYLLIISTPIEIRILGCVFDYNNYLDGDLSLYETQFNISTDNVVILKIIGMNSTGRILCGKDGCVYELNFNSYSNNFLKRIFCSSNHDKNNVSDMITTNTNDTTTINPRSSKKRSMNHQKSYATKIRKLNHSHSLLRSMLPSFLFGNSNEPVIDIVIDQTRTPKLLYSLSINIKTKQNKITVWSLGTNGYQMNLKYTKHNIIKEIISKHISSSHMNTFYNNNSSVANTSTTSHTSSAMKLKNIKIINLYIIPRDQSELIHLIAITNHGYRIYFTYRHHILSIKFVRLCPPYINIDDTTHKLYLPDYKVDYSPRNITSSYYNKGVLLLADNRTERGDTLISIVSNDFDVNKKQNMNLTVAGLNNSKRTTNEVTRHTAVVNTRVSTSSNSNSTTYKPELLSELVQTFGAIDSSANQTYHMGRIQDICEKPYQLMDNQYASFFMLNILINH